MLSGRIRGCAWWIGAECDLLSSLCIDITSEICWTSKIAATRGRRLFPNAE